MEDFGDLISNLTQNAKASLVSADLWSQLTGSDYIGTEHLLLGILSQPEAIATKFLNEDNVTFERVRDLLSVKTNDSNLNNLTAIKVLSESARLSLGMGWSVAREYNQRHLGTEHILFAMLEQKNSQAHALLLRLNTDIEQLYDKLRQYFDRQLSNVASLRNETHGAFSKDLLNQKRRQESSLLRRFGRDLTALASAGQLDPVVAREREIERVITILSRRTKSNPILVGEPGVGKSAIVEGLAQRIVAGKVPFALLDCRLIELDLTALIAGTKFRGEFEDRLHKILSELRHQPQTIVFVDEFHMLVGAGASEGSMDAVNILKPALARGEIRLIGATTFEDYRKHIEKDSALERRLQVVDVAEPTREQAIAMLKGVAKKYEKYHGIKFGHEVIVSAVDLSTRYISERFLPDKAVDLIDEASATCRAKLGYIKKQNQKEIQEYNQLKLALDLALEAEDYQRAAGLKAKLNQLTAKLANLRDKLPQSLELTVDDIAQTLSLRTGVPVCQIAQDQQARLLNLSKTLSKRLLGQDEAIKLVSMALQRSRSGVSAGNRPIGSFVFMGPSGVGKTELAKILAEEMFGGNDALLKIDMSEFSERHSISGLLGAPAGYVGYDDGAKLTDAVRRRPYRVVLFDEIEKADPEIFNILLQILEDGRLSDSKGRSVDFSNTIIILTSNLGSERLNKADNFGFGKTGTLENANLAEQALSSFMRPELINRLDAVVVFNSLTSKDLASIADLLLNDLKLRINRLGYGLNFTAGLRRHLVKLADQAQAGARPLRRLIETEVEQPLALLLIGRQVELGDTIEVAVDRAGKVKLSVKNSEKSLKKASSKTKKVVKTPKLKTTKEKVGAKTNV